jgi:PBSX family phage terminase large subunit
MSDEQEVKSFSPGPGQARVFTTPKRFKFAMGGKRGGKTTVGCYWAAQEMVKMRHRRMTSGEEMMVPPKGLIAAPTFDQLMQSTIAKFFEEFPHMKRYFREYKKQFDVPIGTGPNGKPIISEIFVRSLDVPKNIEGMNLDWEWIDEADSLTEYAWNIARGRVSTTKGHILCTTTIYPASWIYERVYKRADPDYEIITWPSNENPAFPQEEWEKLKEELDPMQFAREYESKFMFDFGRIYSDWSDWSVVDDFPADATPLAWYFGLDFGSADPTAIVVMAYCSDGCWYIVDEYYRENMNIEEINAILEMFVKKYGQPWNTWMDYAGGVAANSVTGTCFPMDAIKGPGSIEKGINLIRNLAFQRRIFVMRRCRNTIRERSLYSWKSAGVPEDSNNHTLDAVRYVLFSSVQAVEGLKKAEPKKRLPTLWAAMEEDGLLKDGVFLNTIDSDDNYIF